MKRTFLITAILVQTLCGKAQLVVDSVGNVGIGTETPIAKLSIGEGGETVSGIDLQYDGNRGMNIITNSTDSAISYGIFLESTSRIGRNIGIKSYGQGSGGNSPYAYGVMGVAGFSKYSMGVAGCHSGYANTESFAGIYGCTQNVIGTTFNHTGYFAGYFKGNLLCTGRIYGTLLSLSDVSTSSARSTLFSPSTEPGRRITDKLGQVDLLLIDRNNTQVKKQPDTVANLNTEERKMQERVKAQEQLSSIQYGLAADQLKSLYPELVYQDEDGNYSINYVEMVPLLVQSIKELSQEIKELKKEVSEKSTQTRSQTKDSDINIENMDIVRMDQNTPNPFSENTVIQLNIPQSTTTANILIYDLNGKQIEKVAIDVRGETNVTVYASNLESGMYIYSLILDGKVAVTRKMIVNRV